VDETMEAAISEWRAHLNAGEYFDAHEALEHAWLAAAEPEKTFLKGLIHVAVALYHYQRGNGHGARVKFGSAMHYLSGYPNEHLGLPVGSLRERLQEFFSELIALPEGSAPPPPGPWPRVE